MMIFVPTVNCCESPPRSPSIYHKVSSSKTVERFNEDFVTYYIERLISLLILAHAPTIRNDNIYMTRNL